jgi:hypothetical protein
MATLHEILSELGYSLQDLGKEYRARPVYRDSNNNTSLKIDKVTGRWVDFSAGVSGSFEELIRITLNLSDIGQAKEWLTNNADYSFDKSLNKPKIRSEKQFPLSILSELEADHSYWIKRKVPLSIIEKFKGGVCHNGRMYNRYVFPIFSPDSKSLLGFAGRDLFKESVRPKWKLLGDKMNWVYPLYLIENRPKEIILVESIGDMLSLYTAGIQNVMVNFGVHLGTARTNWLLRLDPQKIIIALNNDGEENGFVGNESADKMRNQLCKHFDENQILVCLPDKKDFGVMDKEEITKWYESKETVCS